MFVAAYALLVVALGVTHELLSSHIETELKRVGDDAARDYVKAGRFPLHVSQPGKLDPIDLDILNRAFHERRLKDAADAAHVTLPSNIDGEAAYYKLQEAVEKAKNAWLSDHGFEVFARDVSASVGWALTEGILKVLKPVAIYLSLPFKIALGLGFGVALGAWVVKRAGLNDIWR